MTAEDLEADLPQEKQRIEEAILHSDEYSVILTREEILDIIGLMSREWNDKSRTLEKFTDLLRIQ